MSTDFRVIKGYLNDGYIPVFRNARDEVFYLCDLNKRFDINEVVISSSEVFVLTKNIECAIITETFLEAYNIVKSFSSFNRENDSIFEYTGGVGKIYVDENLIVEY